MHVGRVVLLGTVIYRHTLHRLIIVPIITYRYNYVITYNNIKNPPD